MNYEKLLKEADGQAIEVFERKMTPNIKGLYCDQTIAINKEIATAVEKRCILAEELGHYHTSSGNILDQKDLLNRKQELRARNWAYEKLIPLESIISAYNAGVRNRNELAEYLDVIEDFLEQTIKHYQRKHGLYAVVGKYAICLDPLGVLESFE